MRVLSRALSTLTVAWSIMASAYALPPSAPRGEMWVPTNGLVAGMVEADGILYLGGSFTYVGPHTGSGAAVDATTGGVDVLYPRAALGINAVAPDGAGGWFIGGTFLRVDGLTRTRLAHILPNRSVDPNFTIAANNNVRALAYRAATNTLYVAGNFTNLGGQSRNFVGAINTSSNTVTAWNPAPTGFVSALAVSGSTVYIGGGFTFVGGQFRSRIAALDATLNTNNATLWNPSSNGNIWTLCVSGNLVYAGGDFTSLGGQTRNRIAALDATIASNNATPWDPNANADVSALAVDGTMVYAGGNFTTIGGQSRNRIAALDATVNSNNATSWYPPLGSNGSVLTIAVGPNSVFAGGLFTVVGGQSRRGVAAFNKTSGAAIAWNPNPDGNVSGLAIQGNTLYVGGDFTSAGGLTRNRLAAIDVTTGVATAWNPGANNGVLALAISGSTIYAGGDFTSAGGQFRNRIAAISMATGAATTWDPNSDGLVRAIVISGNTVYVGGDFTNIGGAARNRIAALDATISTNNATAWNPNADGGVNALTLSGNTLYAGGGFTAIGGQGRLRIAALDTTINTNNATPWDPSANSSVFALALSGTTLYAGGAFMTIGGAARNRIAALDTTTNTNNATAWNPDCNAPVWAVAIAGTVVYVGGDYITIGGATQPDLAAIDATVDTNNALPWNPSIGGTVFTVTPSADAVFAGGNFSGGSSEAPRNLAAYGTTATQAVPPGGAGNWSQTGTWNTAVVPNNSGPNHFDVEIRGAATAVTQDISPQVGIDTLNVADGATLDVSGGDLHVGSAGIQNLGQLNVANGRALKAELSMTINGTGPLVLVGTSSELGANTIGPVITNAASHLISGQGTITCALNNLGTIRATGAGSLLGLPVAPGTTNDGVVEAAAGATLEFGGSPIGGSGIYRADGATVRLLPSSSISGTVLEGKNNGVIEVQGGGQVNITGLVTLTSGAVLQGANTPSGAVNCTSLEITNGSPGGEVNLSGTMTSAVSNYVRIIGGCGLQLRGCTPPILAMSQGSYMTIGGDLLVDGDAALAITDSAVIDLSGDFNNFGTDPISFDCDAGRVNFVGAQPQSFELAGEDLGPRNPAGFTNNYALGTLRVEPGRSVSFGNAFDNSVTACEVLYVDTLSLGSLSSIQLDGCNIYYRTLVKELGAIVTLVDGAALMSTNAGDLDSDGLATVADLNSFISVLLGGNCSPMPTCAQRADLNGDGVVNGQDIALLIRVMTGW